MRKVDLRMNELEKYEVIKNVVNGRISKKIAHVKLDLSLRQIDRLVIKYKENGKAGFIHGNRNRKPSKAFTEQFKDEIADIYITKYFDCTYTLFNELLAERENIFISIDETRRILIERDILSPKSHKKTKRIIKKRLQEQVKKSKTKKKKCELQSKIVDIQDAHPKQPRCKYFGEELQMDASQHIWFGNEKVHLHAAIDDSTGQVLGAHFEKEETLSGYYHITEQILRIYGIPNKIKADRRTVFEYKKKGIISDENDTFTQYSYAAKQLGITIETSSTPEFKARIERLFGTLQHRLTVLLRLENVTNIEEANTILPKLIKKYNSQFALPIDNTKNVFIKQISEEKINLTLAVLTRRTIDCGHSVKFNKKYYRLVNSKNIPIYFAKGTKCMVIESFDKKLFATVDNSIFAMQEIPEIQAISEDFDSIVEPIVQYVYVPKMIHPWKAESFSKFVENQCLKMQ